MLQRLTSAAIAFAVLAVCYQGYALVLAPFVEPAAAAVQELQEVSPSDLLKPPESLLRYRPLLTAYFPADHWCFRDPPKIIESDQALVVFDRYDQNENGLLRIPRCAIVFFPSGHDLGMDPPRDAIILEPADGATLQMNQTIGRKFGSMGRMQTGHLLGVVTVRSDMKEPGPQDDLSIETKDLYMNEDLIRTTEAVTLHLGNNHGRGRGLEIRFLKAEKSAGAAGTTLFGKLDTLEISREVAALIAPGKTSLFGKPTPTDAPSVGVDKRNQLANDPAEIKCSGPFRIEFNSHVATFTEDVHVWQRRPDGARDELTAPKELTLYFAEMREWGGDVTPTDETEKSALHSIRLEPATVEATGSPDAPVLLNAPSQGAVARGERLRIELIARQVTLGGGDEVTLAYHGAEIHAPMVRYELPPKGSNQQLGIMDASGGGGWLRVAPTPARPTELLEVSWKRSMKLIRSGGQPLLRLDGRPNVSMLGRGSLWADELELYLREIPAAERPAGGAPSAGPVPASIEAERIVASGHVDIDSAELNGHVNQLDLRIFNPAPQTGGAGGATGGAASGIPTTGGGIAAAPTQPSLLDRKRNDGGDPRSYNISGATLELDAVMRDRKPQLTAIRVDGSVVFKESTPAAAGEAPLRIVAEHLAVTDADTQQAKIEIRGGDATGALPAGLAEVAARGTVLRAPKLIVNRGTSHASIDSPGEVQLLMTRDPSGKPLAAPQPLRITWRDSMVLDLDHITFLGNVQVQHADGWVHTERMVAVLTAPVQFDGGGNGQPTDLAQLECWDGVVAEFDQRDVNGAITAHQHMEVVSLVVNQVTGAIRGDGPGHVDSIHFSKGDSSFLVMPENVGKNGEMPTPVQQDAPPGPPELRHLSVDFVRGVDGNIHTPEVRVYGNVHTIYGPVDSWDQRLQMTAGGIPGPETIWISCDSLQVTDSPIARIQNPTPDGRRPAFGLVELRAETNVVIEGVHPKEGAFTLTGNRASFDQAKGMFILQGTPATITRQQFQGGPMEPQSANQFIYWQKTGAFKVVGYGKIDFEQLNAK